VINTSDNKKTMLTTDVIIELEDGIILVRRGNEPFKNYWALPGGFVEYGETVENAAIREVKEETGLEIKLKKLFGVYSEPGRDPRGHTVTICYLGTRIGGKLKAASDADEARIFKEIPWNELAFDHAKILKDAGYR